jgi:hypothetical protein
MGPRQHAGRRMAQRQRIEQFADGRQQRHYDATASRLQHERIGQVVDVFGGARKMYPFEVSGQRTVCLELRSDPIFDRLHIVVGARFDELDRGDIGGGGVCGECRQPGEGRGRQRGERGRRPGRQGGRPCALDANALAHEARFAEQETDFGQLAGITAIEWRKRFNSVGGHRRRRYSVVE